MPKILQSKRGLRCCNTSFGTYSLRGTQVPTDKYWAVWPQEFSPSTKEENEHIAIILRWFTHGSIETIPKLIIVRGILQQELIFILLKQCNWVPITSNTPLKL